MAGSNIALGLDFWQDNPGLALAMVAQKASGSDGSLQQSALEYRAEPHGETTAVQVLEHDQARQAREQLGQTSPLTLDFLESHAHLARLIIENPELARNLALEEKVAQLLLTDDERMKSVLQAYASGLLDQDESKII